MYFFFICHVGPLLEDVYYAPVTFSASNNTGMRIFKQPACADLVKPHH
jgi:hypothetical protein